MLLTPQSELAKVLGEILSKTSGTSYWENPFQVCWDDVKLCRDNLKTTYPPKLLELLLICQLRFLAVYKEFHSISDLNVLIKHCYRVNKIIVRTSRIRIRDLMLIKSENPKMKVVAVYLVQDPRSKLADMKKTKSYRNSHGQLKPWTDKTYQLLIPSICGDMLEAVEYLSGSKHLTSPEQNVKLVSVRYEDLVQDLELEVKQLLHVLNLKYNIITKKLVHRLEFPDEHISETPGRKLDLRLAEAAETNEKWKIILNPEEIRAVENDFRCSKVMKFGGYEFYDFDYDYFAQL